MKVVAPVRESCAQALSIVILHMQPKQTFSKILKTSSDLDLVIYRSC